MRIKRNGKIRNKSVNDDIVRHQAIWIDTDMTEDQMKIECIDGREMDEIDMMNDGVDLEVEVAQEAELAKKVRREVQVVAAVAAKVMSAEDGKAKIERKNRIKMI